MKNIDEKQNETAANDENFDYDKYMLCGFWADLFNLIKSGIIFIAKWVHKTFLSKKGRIIAICVLLVLIISIISVYSYLSYVPKLLTKNYNIPGTNYCCMLPDLVYRQLDEYAIRGITDDGELSLWVVSVDYDEKQSMQDQLFKVLSKYGLGYDDTTSINTCVPLEEYKNMSGYFSSGRYYRNYQLPKYVFVAYSVVLDNKLVVAFIKCEQTYPNWVYIHSYDKLRNKHLLWLNSIEKI